MKIAILDTGINPGHECFKEITNLDEEMDVVQSAPVDLCLKTTGKILGGKDYTEITNLDEEMDVEQSAPVDLCLKTTEKILGGKDYTEISFLDKDQESHGTSVAGVAAGVYNRTLKEAGLKDNDSQFCVGVAPGASLVILRVSHSSMSPYSPNAVYKSLTSIFNYNANESDPRNRIRIVVMPFKLDELDRNVDQAIKDLNDQGVICVAAAGNEGLNEAPPYPALRKDVLAVGSVNAYNRESDFTPSHDDVDLLALGEDVVVPVNDLSNKTLGFCKGGTSFAAPAVGGLIALLLQAAVKYSSDGTAMEKITNLRTLRSLFQKHMTHDKHKKALASEKVVKFFNDEAIDFDKVIKDL